MNTQEQATQIVKLNPKEFGLEENQAQTIESAFMPKIVERDALREVYNNLLTQEITPDLSREAKAVRLKLVKVRTGISEIHKTQKAFFLAAGRFVDAWKKKETLPVEQMEEKLTEIEEYYDRIEAAKVKKLQEERTAELRKYQDETAFIPNNLGELAEPVWQNYLLGVKTAYDQKAAAEKAAAEAEAARVEAEKAEQERIRQENERLKKEAEEKEAALKAEREKAEAERKAREAKEAKEKAEREAKEKAEREAHEAELRKERKERERVEAELKAKAEAERKAVEQAEAAKQAELAKGDADKVQDLINDLKSLKTKYEFKSKKNQKLYQGVGILMDKVVTYIQEGGAK
jgi:hypothetical protein